MSFQRVRRALLGLACLSGALLAACGGGAIESRLTPKRIVAFGDGFSSVGQGDQYTINGDGSVSNWTQQLATRYGLAPLSAGGTSYAVGNARVATQPDAAGNSSTRTITQQIDAFFTNGGSLAADDLVVLSGGIADIVAEAGQNQSTAQAQANVSQAGTALGAQARRLVQAGARYVVLVGPYNLGRTPWATGGAQASVLQDYAVRFNNALLISVVDLGARVLYVDAALYYNLVTGSPGSYALTNVTEAACTSVDPGPGIGIGDGQVNSALCTTSTLRGGIDRNTWFFADPIYPTPVAHRLFGDYAYDRIRARW